MLDPRELELPEVGLLTLVDPETGRRHEVQTSQASKLRERYAAAMAAHREHTAQAIRAAGAAHLVLRTDTDWVRDVAAFASRPPPGQHPPNPSRERRNPMKFEQPLWLWLLLVVAALVVAYVFAQRRRSQYAVRFATLPMLEKVAPKRPGWRRHAPAFAFLAALVVLTIAIARPVADVRVPRERATVVVAMDVSNSMAATDVAPNRFEVAKEAAAEFVNSLPEQFNVGLVSFARTANVVAAPSTNHQAAVDAINRLTLTDSTAIGEAVMTSLQAVRSLDADAANDPPPTRIVLLSDGGNTSGRPIDEAAEAATQAGVPVSTIAYGTPEGTVELDGRSVPVPADADIPAGTGRRHLRFLLLRAERRGTPRPSTPTSSRRSAGPPRNARSPTWWRGSPWPSHCWPAWPRCSGSRAFPEPMEPPMSPHLGHPFRGPHYRPGPPPAAPPAQPPQSETRHPLPRHPGLRPPAPPSPAAAPQAGVTVKPPVRRTGRILGVGYRPVDPGGRSGRGSDRQLG